MKLTRTQTFAHFTATLVTVYVPRSYCKFMLKKIVLLKEEAYQGEFRTWPCDFKRYFVCKRGIAPSVYWDAAAVLQQPPEKHYQQTSYHFSCPAAELLQLAPHVRYQPAHLTWTPAWEMNWKFLRKSGVTDVQIWLFLRRMSIQQEIQEVNWVLATSCSARAWGSNNSIALWRRNEVLIETLFFPFLLCFLQ